MNFSREAAKNAKMSEFRRRKIFLEEKRGLLSKTLSCAFFAASREEKIAVKICPLLWMHHIEPHEKMRVVA